MNSNINRYLKEKLSLAYQQLNKTLKEYFLLNNIKEKLQYNIQELELQLKSDYQIYPKWQELKNNPLTFDIYEEILVLEIQVNHKRKELIELMSKVLNKRVEVEENKRAVIDIKVDMHWLEDDKDID